MNDDVLIRHFAGRTTPDEQQRLEAWRRSDAEHERRYVEMAMLLRAAERAELGWRDQRLPAAAELVRLAHGPEPSDVVPQPSGVARPARRRHLVQGLAAAAMIGLGIGLTAMFLVWRYARPFGVEEFVTSAAETVTVSLKDGSIVRLAPNSRLRVLGRQTERRVSLAGRAFFAIAKRMGRPFRIQTAAGDVTVIGTRFDLETDADDLRVLVVEGTVALSSPDGQTRVTGGQMGRVIRGVPVPPVRVPDVSAMIDWTGRFLAFQETPLEQVAREIEREFQVRVEIDRAALGQRTFTGWFSGWTLAQVMDVVCAVSNAECSIEDGVVTMRSR